MDEREGSEGVQREQGEIRQCPLCTAEARHNAGMLGFIYALGRVEPRFPNLGVEKELAQATGRGYAGGLTDRQALHAVLSQPPNRYLARQLCWVLTIEAVETYLLVPRDPADLDRLIETVRPAPRSTDVDIVIGVRGPIAAPDVCNGLVVPIVLLDQIYSFDVESLIKAIPRPKEIPQRKFAETAEELFFRVIHMADNAGSTDDHRALNYLAVRYDKVYAVAADAFGRGFSLTSVYVRQSRLAGPRRVVDVVFSYTHRQTDVTEKYFVRVDVTNEFPFLVNKISPYYVYDQNP